MVEVCIICGDRGFSNALLDCSACSSSSAHQYCLGIQPGSIDDTYNWVCEFCSVPMETESCRIRGAISLGASQSCSGDLEIESTSKIVALLEPLCMLSPIQYHGGFTIDETSNSSQKHEAAISSFMEHPDSILRGTVLLVSPSGEVFIDEEKSSSEYFFSLAKPGPYKVKDELFPHGETVENNLDSTETMELHDLKLRSLGEVDSFEENDDYLSVSASSKLDVEALNHELASLENKCESGRIRKSFVCPEENEATAHIVGSKAEVWSNHSVGSSMEDLQRGTLKRALDPEVEAIQQKKATIHKILGDVEGPSSEPLGNLKEKNELIKRQNDKCKMKLYRNRKLSIGEALAQTKKTIRNQIVSMLLNAGWTVEYRPQKRGKGSCDIKRYVSPQGTVYGSVARAYRKLARDEEAKAMKSELGEGSDNSNFGFTPLSKELLSVLSSGEHLFTKK